jgi:transposase
VDIILGKDRRRWSREDKLSIVAETFEPGAIVLDVARRRQISSGQIYTWRKQFRAELGFPESEPATPAAAAAMQFMPVAITAERPATMIEVDFTGGAKLKMSGGVDLSLLMALIKALATKPR